MSTTCSDERQPLKNTTAKESNRRNDDDNDPAMKTKTKKKTGYSIIYLSVVVASIIFVGALNKSFLFPAGGGGGGDTTSSLLRTSAEVSTTGSFLPTQCADFQALNFDILNYSEYDRYFDEESKLTLAQTGVYKGPDAIEEYVKFVDDSSPYIDAKSRFFGESELSGFDADTGTCKFSIYTLQTLTLDEDITEGGTLSYGALQNVYYSIPAVKIAKIHVYYSTEFLGEFFGRLNTPNVAGFICDVLTGASCKDTDIPMLNGNLSQQKCMRKVLKLPVAEGEKNYIDSNTRGCRALHVVFAASNSFHCAHVSLVPAQDSKGNIKCQTSANIQPSELFMEAEILKLSTICEANPQIGTNSCVTVVVDTPTSRPTPNKPTKTSKSKHSKASKKGKGNKA
mmetsp:Transcript_20961/g.23230  ORF Transcript_20961/g.23230 Transcript_20961/m.23230 type:complete len:396 (-) Transcript_20961:26-1213(-)